MTEAPRGQGIQPILALKPVFYWDAYKNGFLKKTLDLVDDDSESTAEKFCYYHPGMEKFIGITPAANPQDVLGPCGHFYDGSIQQRWDIAWDTANLGFSVVSPTPSGAMYQDTGVKPSIVDENTLTHGDVTVLDTDGESDDVVVEVGIPRSATYSRCAQIMIRSRDGNTPYGRAQVIVDGDMETAGVGSWTATNGATLSKESSDPAEGTQNIRVLHTGTDYPGASQTHTPSTVTDSKLHITGWARTNGDADVTADIADSTDASLATVATGSTWTWFDVEVTPDPTSTGIRFRVAGAGQSSGDWVEFDDVTVEQMRQIVWMNFDPSSGTRNADATSILREMPNSDGWWTLSNITGTGTGDTYCSIYVEKDSGEWEIAAPLFFSIWSVMEYVPKVPVPVYAEQRGGWYVESNAADVPILPQGWLAASVVLPDRSIDWGHVDYSLAGDYRFLGLLNIETGGYRVRLSMSDSNDELAVHLGTTSSATIAYLNCPSDWNEFAGFGIVAIWEISKGVQYTTLYVNGLKEDAGTPTPGDWFPAMMAPAKMVIGGSEVGSGTIAEGWISRVAWGRCRISRSYGRALSMHMYKIARGKREGGFTERYYKGYVA